MDRIKEILKEINYTIDILKSENIKHNLDEIISYFVIKYGIRINHG